jgi:hypothetical protein
MYPQEPFHSASGRLMLMGACFLNSVSGKKVFFAENLPFKDRLGEDDKRKRT